MSNFTLNIIYTIPGISAASGLFLHDDLLYLISDNANAIYQYNIGSGELQKKPLLDTGISDNINKKQKPDFEALAYYNDDLYAFGSGSAANRNLMVRFGLNAGNVISVNDLSAIYNAMKIHAGIGDEFNLEGVVITKDAYYFFQRGNGSSGHNGIFKVNGDITGQDFDISYFNFELPAIGRISATFTDATKVGDNIFFLASAENSQSVYDDGEILGSMIGRINLETMAIDFVMQISSQHKFEGITLLEERKSEIIFLLCEDNDTADSKANIYKLSLSL